MNSRFQNILIKLRAIRDLLNSGAVPKPSVGGTPDEKEKKLRTANPVLMAPNAAAIRVGVEKRIATAEAYANEFAGYWGSDAFDSELGQTPAHIEEMISLEADFGQLSGNAGLSEFADVIGRSAAVATKVLDLVKPKAK
jgi:hypothetical protein